MEADKRSVFPATEASSSWPRLSAILARGCCVLPVALMFLTGIVSTWVKSLGISDLVWSWIALAAFIAASAAVLVQQLLKRRRGATPPEVQPLPGSEIFQIPLHVPARQGTFIRLPRRGAVHAKSHLHCPR